MDLGFQLDELSRTLDYDLPWLSEEPVSGTLVPGEGIAVDVVFDSAGLTAGVYLGLLDVESNDPVTPYVSIPVTLTVLPCEPVTATAFSWACLRENVWASVARPRRSPWQNSRMEMQEFCTPTVGEVVTFTASASGTEPIAYDWEFGNGNFGFGNPLTQVYTMAGAYTVTLTATNGCGAEVVQHTVVVEAPPTPTWEVYLPIVTRVHRGQ
jgi:hypothetical protein